MFQTMTIRFSCLANNFSLSFAWCVRAQASELCQLNQIKSNLILAQGKQTWELLFWRTSWNPRFFQILNNPSLSHAGQNYWMLIGWDRGHFSLIKRALLVVKRAWLLDADWLSMPALNRPFYSCVLSYLAMNASEAGGDLTLIQTSLLFSCKCQLVSIRRTWLA